MGTERRRHLPVHHRPGAGKLEKKPEALAAYKKLVETLPFAQCWDPQGWFWKPAEGAKGRVKALEFDSLK